MMSTQPNNKNQHYVWRHYLSAWAKDGTFCCYRQKDKKLFSTQPKVIANETYFYEVKQLTADDKKFLDVVISKATDERLRKLNRDYVDMTQRTFKLRDQLKGKGLLLLERADLEEEMRWIEKNLLERYHAGIEASSQDILGALQSGDNAFYKDEARCVQFFYFLSLQYFRTAKMRNGLNSIPSHVPGHDASRTANILNHILATNVSAGLFRERNAYRIVFLKNETPIPFIAGDQPILNMLDPLKTDGLELYYPLSPKLAILLTKDISKLPKHERCVTLFEVEHYNYSIYSHSEDQVYSSDEHYLRQLVTIGKHIL